LPLSEAKAKRLKSLSTPDGIIAALAIDQRKSMRRMIADAAGKPIEQITDAHLIEFKSAVTQALTPHASAVLLDPEYGIEAASKRAPGCGLLIAYEMDGYENPRPHKMLALRPELSVSRIRDLGADGVKILLTYTPFEDQAANDAKHALIERIGAECEALDMPFFLEPVGYDTQGADPKSCEYARLKPEIVIGSMEEFSKPVYKVDILKVEFPVNAAYVDAAYTRLEALDIFRRADKSTNLPYIYLSAGVSMEQFKAQLNLAAESGACYCGVLCGRATWQEGAAAYARGGLSALSEWLTNEGVPKMKALNQCLKPARSWRN
jgi:tagatose 1,6-diphosphate aldolase